MSTYDNNTGTIVIPANSVFSSLNSNRGTIIVGPNSKFSECNNNHGVIEFGRGLCIRNINNNFSQISIGNDSKVDLIADNCGSISLASNCVVMSTKNNCGSIVGGKPNFNSDFKSSSDKHTYVYRYNSTYDFSPSDGQRSGSNEESLRTMFDNLNLGSLGEGIVNVINCVDPHSNFSDTKVQPETQPSKSKKDVPSAPSLDSDSEDNASVPTAPTLKDADETICAICVERPKTVAFQCGHLCCVNCSEMLIACHMCRVKINQKIKLFF